MGERQHVAPLTIETDFGKLQEEQQPGSQATAAGDCQPEAQSLRDHL
jgi:hypothetical protein